MEHYDILIIGAGAAGIAAAKAAYQAGSRSILLVDRKAEPGGVLLQCMHHGFGNGMNGPDYVKKLLAEFPVEISCHMNTSVLSVTNTREAFLSGPEIGRKTVHFHQLILAAGCLEIPFGALPIAGTRPTGIYSAGQLQELMNLHAFLPEGPVVILGSGDLGLIMAKHILDAGIPIAALVEQKSSCGGMARNQRFLVNAEIPLRFNSTIAEVYGHPQLECVRLSDGSVIPCRTLLIAAGMRPDRTLLHRLGQPEWLHLCGNCSKVHPMVEAVVQEGKQVGYAAAAALNKTIEKR